MLAGELPAGKTRLVQAWIEIHRDELLANWRLAMDGQGVFRIGPLKMNPHVKSVRALDNYELELSFENGECRRFDVKPYLHRGIFVRLRDRSVFRAARVVAGSVEWPDGLDLSYDTLYVEGQPTTATTPRAEQGNPADAR